MVFNFNKCRLIFFNFIKKDKSFITRRAKLVAVVKTDSTTNHLEVKKLNFRKIHNPFYSRLQKAVADELPQYQYGNC